jgi:hypothetical protein
VKTKTAHVLLALSPAKKIMWQSFIELAAEKFIREEGDQTVVSLSVKAYSLEDHQFLQIRTETTKGGDFVAWIPRDLVITIIEGKNALAGNFYFAPKQK